MDSRKARSIEYQATTNAGNVGAYSASMKKIKIRWYGGDGVYDGTEYSTEAEIRARLDGKATITLDTAELIIFRLAGTGEVARCYPQ